MFTGRGSVLGIAGKALRGASILVLAVVAGLSAFAVAGAAQPLDQASLERGAGCDAFPWSVDHERKWFADAKLRHSDSGVRLSRIDRAVDLKLVPTKSVAFFLPPQRTPKPNSYSGEVTFFGVPHPGIYQVTISRDAWVDVFENGTRITSVADEEAKDCDEVRKSVRFALAPGDLVLVQVSGAMGPSIKVAFEEAP